MVRVPVLVTGQMNSKDAPLEIMVPALVKLSVDQLTKKSPLLLMAAPAALVTGPQGRMICSWVSSSSCWKIGIEK